MDLNDIQDKLREINDKINELQYKYFTCNIDSSKSWQIEYELDYLYDLRNNLMSHETKF